MSPLLDPGLKKILVQLGTQEIKLFLNQGLRFESLVGPWTQEIKLCRTKVSNLSPLVKPGTQEIFRTKVSNLSPLFDLGHQKLSIRKSNSQLRTQEMTLSATYQLGQKKNIFDSQVLIDQGLKESLVLVSCQEGL